MTVSRWKSLSYSAWAILLPMEIAWLCASFYKPVSNGCGWNSKIQLFERVSLYICVYIVYFTLNKNINATCKVLVPCFTNWNKITQICSIPTKSFFLSSLVHKFVNIPVSEHLFFAKIIYPPDRCGISSSGLNSMIITQVRLVLGTIKGHWKMCCFVTQDNATDVKLRVPCNCHADCRNVH
jgi:hypothetical protein